MTALLGRLLNRIGHRLVRWGYALEVWAYRRRSFKYKITFTDAKGNEVPYSPGPSDGIVVDDPWQPVPKEGAPPGSIVASTQGAWWYRMPAGKEENKP